MSVFIYIISLAIAFIIKKNTGKLLYKKFGAKCIKYFNISTAIVAFLVMTYFIFIYTNNHPVYPVMFGGTLGLIWGNFKVNSDRKKGN